MISYRIESLHVRWESIRGTLHNLRNTVNARLDLVNVVLEGRVVGAGEFAAVVKSVSKNLQGVVQHTTNNNEVLAEFRRGRVRHELPKG